MNEVMNHILTNLLREERPVRFEVRRGDFTNRYDVRYRFADENGRSYTVFASLVRSEAERIVDEGNVALGSLLAPHTYSF